ncbi:MAG TPA: arsenic resistance N-acetyltransferase ArsN2 [Lysobacter sp.]
MQPGTARHGRGVLQSEVGLLLRRDVTLRPLLIGEMPQVRALLTSASLPVDDLDEASIHFIVAGEGDEAIGAIGLESFGSVGLLRSMVVRPDARGSGIGGQLVEALERHAREIGMDQLVLLTQTAEPFFATRGYAVIAREAAPAAVRRSAEFRSICPASAICMTRQLRAMP